jgi:hypothetical protein
MDIPGLKNLRLLAVQPLVLLPTAGIDMAHEKEYFMEFTFDSGSVLNVHIRKSQYDDYLRFMTQQGTAVEQRVVASSGMPSSLEHVKPLTGVPIPVTGPVNIEAELRKVVAAEAGDQNINPVDPVLPPKSEP